jgi:hypothetical protein
MGEKRFRASQRDATAKSRHHADAPMILYAGAAGAAPALGDERESLLHLLSSGL